MLSPKNTASNLLLQSIDISGPAVKNAQAVMIRWRPTACHGTLSTTQAKPIVVVGHLKRLTTTSAFTPMTTAFGYFNPSFLSIWCHLRKGETADPLKSNYLVGVNKRNIFGSFNHEGVGVKLRNEDSPEANKTRDELKKLWAREYIAALKCEPFGDSTQYTVYYLDPRTRKWKYRGSCVKRKAFKPITHLGAFVEVPGRATKQRTGPVRRESILKAWFVNSDKTITPADSVRADGTNPETNSYRHTYVDKKGYLHLIMGGWDAATAPKRERLKNPIPVDKDFFILDCLEGENVNALFTAPVVYQNRQAAPTKITENSAEVTVTLEKGFGPESRLFVSYDTRDCVTFGKNMQAVPEFKPILWRNELDAGIIEGKEMRVVLPDLKSGTRYFYRFRVENEEAKIWDTKTYSFNTK